MNDKLVEDYEKKGHEIIYEMTKVLMRAQKKADDKKYRESLSKLKEL